MRPFYIFDEALARFCEYNIQRFTTKRYYLHYYNDKGHNAWVLYYWDEPTLNTHSRIKKTVDALHKGGMPCKEISRLLISVWKIDRYSLKGAIEFGHINDALKEVRGDFIKEDSAKKDYKQQEVFPIVVLYDDDNEPQLLMTSKDIKTGRPCTVLAVNIKNQKEFCLVRDTVVSALKARGV